MLFKTDPFNNTIRCPIAQSEKSAATNLLLESASGPASTDRQGFAVQAAMMKFMMRSRASRQSMCLIALVPLLYGTLIVMAAGCASALADRSQKHQSHHSEQGSFGLNSLCAWACQATADTVVAIEPSPTVMEILAGPADLIPYPFIPSVDVSAVSTRAPPSILFVRLR